MRDDVARLSAALAERYGIERELGQGGMATVYLAHDVRHDRPVALKVLRAELAAVIGAERFLAEIRTTANLQHPHILPLHDSGEAGGAVFYVMPYVEGESLRDRLTREKQLPIGEALGIAAEVADALGYAHERGVIHRDIKPENILLQRGHALVADFGIALALTKIGGGRLTETGMSLGTPAYMAPEQAMGERDITPKADVYALGCVLYEMLLGEPPFTGPTAQAIVAKVLTEKPGPIASRRERVPEHVEEAVSTALEKLPADRFASAAEFADALKGVGAARPARRRPAGPLVPRPAWVPGRPLALGGVILAAGAFWLGRASAHRPTPPIARFGRVTKVTYDRGLEIQPAISPDGRSVAYAAGTSVTMRIFVRQVAGGRAIPLTGDSSEAESGPTWSADGTRILFLARGGVFSAPSSGGDAQPEIPAPSSGSIASAVWSPDGGRVAYVVGDSLLLWANHSRERRVATIHDPTLCRWSPSGKLIACVSGNSFYLAPGPMLANSAPSRIVVVRVVDGAAATVTDSASLNQSPVWSPDSRWVYFVSDRDGPRDVYAVPVASDGRADGQPLRLTTGLGAASLSLSADGSRMAYAALTATANVWSLPLPLRGQASVTDAVQVTSGDQLIEDPNVSWDGKWLVYSSDLAGKGQIYRVALPHGTPERLTSDPYDDYSPDLSPDDREVVFHSFRTGSRDIYVQPLDGGPVQQVTSSPRQEAAARWSPDGHALAFMNLDPPGGIWVVRRRSDGGWGTPVERWPTGYLPNWSADGRSLLFVSSISGGSIWTVPADSGPAEMLLGPPRSSLRVQEANWSADGRTLYFKVIGAGGSASMMAVSAGGGAPRLLARFDDPSRPFYRPNFKIRRGHLYFSIDDRQADVYVMEVVTR